LTQTLSRSCKGTSTLCRKNLKTQQSPAVSDLCVRTTRSGRSHDYRDVIVFEKLRFQNVFCPHENEKPAFSNSSGLKSVFEKFRFRDGLVWGVGLTVEIKLCFQIPPPKYGRGLTQTNSYEHCYNIKYRRILKKESTTSSSNKWTKTLYQDYLHHIANFCATVLIYLLKRNHF